MLSKREVVTEWLLRGPVPLPELCDLVCQYMLMFEGSSSQILWGFPPSIIQPEVSLLDNDRVALFYRSTLEVRDMYTGHILWTCVGHTKFIGAVVDLGSGLIASSEFGGVVRIWRQHVCVREIPVQNLAKIIALPGSRLASYTHHLHADNFVQVWTADGDCTLNLKMVPKGYDICGLTALNSNEIAFGYGENVYVHDTWTGERTTTLHAQWKIGRLFLMPRNCLATMSYTLTKVSVWCLQSSTCLHTIDLMPNGVIPAVLSDGTLVSQHGLDLQIHDLFLNRHLLTAPTRWYRAMLPLKNGLVLKVSHVDVSISS
jgi:hypothetical protein